MQNTTTCPNKACEKEIVKTLKTTDLINPSQTYDACPYCLTPNKPIQQEQTLHEEKQDITSQPEVQPKEKQKQESSCKYQQGYLNKKDKNEPIPQECLVCPKIIDCMLQNPQ